MPKLTFIGVDGAARTVEAKTGDSVMQTALKYSVPGIDADCGGACACATCHVYVQDAWVDRLDPPSDMEKSMLDFATQVQPSSRLSCQIPMSQQLDGLVVTLPASQH